MTSGTGNGFARVRATGFAAAFTFSVAVAAILVASAGAATVRKIPIRNGVTSIALSVPHKSARRPPAILVSLRPAGLPCAVLRYSYHAVDRRAKFAMRLRCRRVPAGAKVRITFRAPYVRVFRLHNGTATLRLHLDKLPGHALPMAQLTTRPRATHCTAKPNGVHIGRHVLRASARITCHGLRHNAKGVLAVGGLLAAGGLTVSPSSPKAMTASVLPCSSSRTLSLFGHSLTWIYCYTPSTDLGPWQTTYIGILPPNPPCPAGWLRVGQISNDLLRVALANLYPPAPYATPTDAWAWSYYLGLVTNWQFSGHINVMWQYNCYQVS